MTTPFTADDFARRMARAADQAEAAGLTGSSSRPVPISSTSRVTCRWRSPSG